MLAGVWTGNTPMWGEELMVLEGEAQRAASTRQTSRRDTLARVTLLLVACGLLIALWTVLWVPSTPVH